MVLLTNAKTIFVIVKKGKYLSYRENLDKYYWGKDISKCEHYTKLAVAVAIRATNTMEIDKKSAYVKTVTKTTSWSD